jgi:hypothetical protein
MGVYINGMDMPDNCFHCSFCRNDLSSPVRLRVDCTATDNTIIECDYDSEEAWIKLHDGRQEWCPLAEIEEGKLFAVKDNVLYRAEFTHPESNVIVIPDYQFIKKKDGEG